MKKGELGMEKVAKLLIALAVLILIILFIFQLRTGGINVIEKLKGLI